ncbi:MAG TPA: phosphoglucosamine mutase [Planctomycetota bacterium]|nr:phosphoglucosamine mutase [Planctomycetota bacterium]
MSSDLMISISGVRGIIGKSLTPRLITSLGEAYGTYINRGRVVVGRDTRVSGEMVKHALLGGLLSTGCKIIDVGVVATPTLTLAIEHLKADGGVMVSASHNPIEWNALKFFRSDGIYLNDEEGRELLNIYYGGDFPHVGWDGLSDIEFNTHANALHVQEVLEIVDANAIRQCKFKVALDCVHGAGVAVCLELLDRLGCTVEKLHCIPDGLFPHYPEPNFVNLKDLIARCGKKDVNIGFAVDPDADRIALVTEKGEFAGEELSLAITADHVLSQYQAQKLPIRGYVVNMSTSRINQDIAEKYGAPFFRTPVGEVNVAEKMKHEKASIGGEGNGGVIDPRIHYGRDSLCGIALTLEAMAKTGKTLSELIAKHKPYEMIKSKINCPRTQARRVLVALKEEIPDAQSVDMSDGLRIDWKDKWVHIRGSNTEPIMRVIAEAAKPGDAKKLVEQFMQKVEALVGPQVADEAAH